MRADRILATAAVLALAWAAPSTQAAEPARHLAQVRSQPPAEHRPPLGPSRGPTRIKGHGGDYALLKPLRQPGYVLLQLKADKGEVLDAAWDPTWVWSSSTTDHELENEAKLEWYGQASCAKGIQSFKVYGPGGTQSQTLKADQKSLHGNFEAQSFTVATLKKICIDWAKKKPVGWPKTDQLVEQYHEWDLTGGLSPTGSADRLHLVASCKGGGTIDHYYGGKLRLRCSREGV
jgi:hypothetical protein